MTPCMINVCNLANIYDILPHRNMQKLILMWIINPFTSGISSFAQRPISRFMTYEGSGRYRVRWLCNLLPTRWSGGRGVVLIRISSRGIQGQPLLLLLAPASTWMAAGMCPEGCRGCYSYQACWPLSRTVTIQRRPGSGCGYFTPHIPGYTLLFYHYYKKNWIEN